MLNERNCERRGQRGQILEKKNEQKISKTLKNSRGRHNNKEPINKAEQ